MYKGRAAVNRKDLRQMRFGRLTVLSLAGYSKSGNLVWKCQCECGNVANVVGSKLLNGHTKSCGCLRRSEDIRGESHTRLYHIWKGMLARCSSPANDNYKWYGGKGVEVCSQWRRYTAFRQWAFANGYQENLEIDRIDSSGNYEPSNCRWLTRKEQANNKSSNRYVTYRDRIFTVSQFAELIGRSYHVVLRRLNKGWDTEKIAQEG